MKTLTKPRKIAIGAGASLGLAGVAFAAVLLSAPITGNLGVSDVNSRLVIQRAQGISQWSNMDCAAGDLNNAVSVTATVRRVNGNIASQQCTVAVSVLNDGPAPVTGVAVAADGALPQGWKFEASADNTKSIPAGASSDLIFSIQAGGTGVTEVGTGKFTGKVSGSVD